MKKFLSTFVIFACLWIALPAQAQVKFGLKGGLNISTLSFSQDVVKGDNRTGFFVGPMVEFTLPVVGLGFDDRMIIEAISDLKPVNGRMELIPNKHKITIIVDYCCHTKDFENVFKFADRVSRGNIIAVLGAPSKRHMARRKKQGKLVLLDWLEEKGQQSNAALARLMHA